MAAQRTLKWSDFRKARGIDNALRVTRRIANDWVALIRLFDIEKAYPRVSRDALWNALASKGCSLFFLKICHALHEHTRYSVKMCDGNSSSYVADKGLREGCPSSPTLFNVYHHAVMEDLRGQGPAQQTGMEPWIPWNVKVDGRVDHQNQNRTATAGTCSDVLGLKTL